MSLLDPACTGKERFPDRALAERVARRVAMNRAARGRSRNSKGAPEPYHCDACGGWHIGRRRK
jgi:hypothetical protein